MNNKIWKIEKKFVYLQCQKINKKKTKIMAQANCTVETIVHKDVRDNELLYIKITKDQKKVLINVGHKTIKALNELLETNGKPSITQPK